MVIDSDSEFPVIRIDIRVTFPIGTMRPDNTYTLSTGSYLHSGIMESENWKECIGAELEECAQKIVRAVKEQ
jgi:hypothetical protein